MNAGVSIVPRASTRRPRRANVSRSTPRSSNVIDRTETRLPMRSILIGSRDKRHSLLRHLRSAVLGLFFRALYGPGARIYDRFTQIAFAGEWKRWQAAALPWLPGGSVVVELGSGTGDFAAAAAGTARTWIALDTSLEMITT